MLNPRFFIAINPPEDIKKELSKFRSLWSEIPAKWTESKNVHITLSFPGSIEKEAIKKIEDALTQITSKINPFNIILTKVSYISASSKIPEMIWAAIEKTDDLIRLKKDIDRRLGDICKLEKVTQEKNFSPHITLAKIKKWRIKQFDMRDLPRMNEDIFLEFKADSIELMESKLTKNGPKYRIVKSFPMIRITI